jgi:transposase
MAKGSHNSPKPPSSDGRKRKPKSLRQRSGKKPVGQLGHRGETLRLVATPNVMVEHRPATCAYCQTALDGAPVVRRAGGGCALGAPPSRGKRALAEVPPG